MDKGNRDAEMSIYEHLEELRRRLIWAAVALFTAVVVSFSFADDALEILTRPVGNLVMMRPSEGFFVHVRLSLWMGLILSSPMILYQLVAFVTPGLTRLERRILYVFLPAGLLFFAAGAAFGFFVIVPFVYRFFLGFTSESLRPFISVDSYVSFVTGLVIPFGMIFELPLVVVVLTFLGIITPRFLIRNRKYALLIVVVIAAFLTPPDVISQIMMAVPLMGLFELSILLSRIVYRRRGQAEEEPGDL